MWRHSRTAQRPPKGWSRTFYLVGGRGSGKTRAGAEIFADLILSSPPLESGEDSEWAIVAPTYADARDVCMEGPSGLLKALGSAAGNWNRSMGELYVRNGAKVFIDGADDGAYRIQGKNLRGNWSDEIGLWRNWQTAWNESLAFAIRLEPGLIVATGTPKTGHGLVRELLGDPAVVVTRMRMLDNAPNLHEATVQMLTDKWAGTRRGRQELEGEFIEDVAGALWTPETIERHRIHAVPVEVKMSRCVVGVDPSGASDEDTGADSIGIIAAGWSITTGHGYVLSDKTVNAGPHAWASEAVALYHQTNADLIVAEKNFGGEMVRYTIHTIDDTVPVKLVSASRGKAVRADPVSALYEQGKIHHVGVFPELEEQLTTWVPDDPRQASPDRLDALVWCFTELMVKGGGQAKSVSYTGGGSPPVRVRGDLRQVGEKYVDRPS